MQPKSRRATHTIYIESLSRHYSIYTHGWCAAASSKSCRAHGSSNQPTNPASRFAQLAGRNRSRCFALQTRPAGGACCCMQSTHSLSEKHTPTALQVAATICLRNERMADAATCFAFYFLVLRKIHSPAFLNIWRSEAKKMLLNSYIMTDWVPEITLLYYRSIF
jgi:hypothetical protein